MHMHVFISHMTRTHTYMHAQTYTPGQRRTREQNAHVIHRPLLPYTQVSFAIYTGLFCHIRRSLLPYTHLGSDGRANNERMSHARRRRQAAERMAVHPQCLPAA